MINIRLLAFLHKVQWTVASRTSKNGLPGDKPFCKAVWLLYSRFSMHVHKLLPTSGAMFSLFFLNFILLFRIQSSYSALQRINQDLEEKIHRDVSVWSRACMCWFEAFMQILVLVKEEGVGEKQVTRRGEHFEAQIENESPCCLCHWH